MSLVMISVQWYEPILREAQHSTARRHCCSRQHDGAAHEERAAAADAAAAEAQETRATTRGPLLALPYIVYCSLLFASNCSCVTVPTITIT
eukprot:3067532-Amphidinium_carterae.1